MCSMDVDYDNVYISVAAKCEQRAVIRFFHKKQKSASDIHKELMEVYGRNAISYVMVWKWCKKFEEGRTEVHDEQRSGRPSVITEELVDNVQAKIQEDRRVKISELCDHFPAVSRGTMHEIVRNCLGYKKICARWVPHQLTDDHLSKRMGSCLEMLTRYHNEGEEFLDRLITCDETWVSYITPESKNDSM